MHLTGVLHPGPTSTCHLLESHLASWYLCSLPLELIIKEENHHKTLRREFAIFFCKHMVYQGARYTEKDTPQKTQKMPSDRDRGDHFKVPKAKRSDQDKQALRVTAQLLSGKLHTLSRSSGALRKTTQAKKW